MSHGGPYARHIVCYRFDPGWLSSYPVLAPLRNTLTIDLGPLSLFFFVCRMRITMITLKSFCENFLNDICKWFSTVPDIYSVLKQPAFCVLVTRRLLSKGLEPRGWGLIHPPAARGYSLHLILIKQWDCERQSQHQVYLCVFRRAFPYARHIECYRFDPGWLSSYRTEYHCIVRRC